MFEELKKQQPKLWEAEKSAFEKAVPAVTTVRTTGPAHQETSFPTHIPPGVSYKCDTPYRAPSLSADVVVPLARACVPGVMVAVAVLGLGLGLGELFKVDLDLFLAIGIVSFSITALVWYLNNHKYDTELLWRMESVTGSDINRDGVVGKPALPNLPTVEAIARTPRDDSEFYWKDRSWAKEQRIEWGMIETFINAAWDHSGQLTLELADDAGLARDEWDRLVQFLTRTGLATPKRQGVEAKLRQDALATLNKLIEVEEAKAQ